MRQIAKATGEELAGLNHRSAAPTLEHALMLIAHNLPTTATGFAHMLQEAGGAAKLFDTVDKKHKVFRKLASSGTDGHLDLALRRHDRHAAASQGLSGASSPWAPDREPSVHEQADKTLLAEVAAVGVTVDARYGIVEFRGDTGPYLANRPGRSSLNLLDMIHHELAGQVRSALAEAARTRAKVTLEEIHLGKGAARRAIDLRVIPFDSTASGGHYLVLFDEVAPPRDARDRPSAAPTHGGSGEAGEVRRLHDELSATRERLEAVIADKEAVNEELGAANEEMLSSGEEMQSVNEELETTHEELQSTNQELRARNDELGQVGNDLTNLLSSVSFPIVMVDRGLRIRRFTPAAQAVLNVIPGDLGRLITDLRLHIDVPDLASLLGEVIDTRLLDVVYGPPLGSFERPYADGHTMLTLEDYLMLYTDGVTEANRASELFGDERLLAAVSGLRGRSAQEFAEGVRDAALAFAGQLRDDLQVVVLRLA